MNPNPTGYHAFQQHGNPMLTSPTGYPVQGPSPSNHNQQVPFYPIAMASYPGSKTPQGPHPLQQHQHHQHHQQQQHQYQPQHSFISMPAQTSGLSAAMMPPSMLQQSRGPHANLPFTAPSPYPSATIPTTTAASPSHSQEPSMLPTTAPAASQNMAAFSNPTMFPAQQRPSQPSNQQPQGPAPSTVAQSQTAARDKARISALLDINSALLQEVVSLQAQGKAGNPSIAPGSQQASPTQEQHSASPVSAPEQQNNTNDSSKLPPQKPSQEYIECMRRLQGNLAYLATIADRTKKASAALPAAPAILSPPPNLPSLNEMYAKLNELFPGAPQGPSTTPQQQRPGQQVSTPGNAGPSPVAVGDNGV